MKRPCAIPMLAWHNSTMLREPQKNGACWSGVLTPDERTSAQLAAGVKEPKKKRIGRCKGFIHIHTSENRKTQHAIFKFPLRRARDASA